MTFIQALKASDQWKSTIISYTGQNYTHEDLQIKSIGKEIFVYNSCGITKEERKGDWKTA